MIFRNIARIVLDRLPYVGRIRRDIRDLQNHIRLAEGEFPAGHYYSPIPRDVDVRQYLENSWHLKDSVDEVDLNTEEQASLLDTFADLYTELPFTEERCADNRFCFDQTMFCYADAVILYCFLRLIKPRRIVEIGSGYSTAVMLDTIERFLSPPPVLTLIEPFPQRLKSLLHKNDQDMFTLYEQSLQQASGNPFESLAAGDLLFIDSSHVVKCGSDVQMLLFEILPKLKNGVFVHLHDIFYPFEYPEEWLKKGWYWNEAYFLRAFLAYNTTWKIVWFNSYMVRKYENFFINKMPICIKNPGGSIYIKKVG